MAKAVTYCVAYQGLMEKPPNTKHYVVSKVDDEDDDTPPEMRSVYDVTIRDGSDRKYRSCNCPGFTYHRSESARGANHKHFRLVNFYEQNVEEGKHPLAGMLIKMHPDGSLERIANPFSPEGLDDI